MRTQDSLRRSCSGDCLQDGSAPPEAAPSGLLRGAREMFGRTTWKGGDAVEITSRPFGTTRDGRTVTCFTLRNKAGMTVELLDWGCVVRALWVPDRDGALTDVVLGYDDLEGYEQGSCFFGAVVGRYANRIKDAAFSLHGRTYRLERNDGKNHLHGCYCSALFAAQSDCDSVTFRRCSPDGEEGYPGTLHVEVRYTLTGDNELQIRYTARAEGDTVLNLTNHSYFNLAGQGRGNVMDHYVQLSCDRFTEADGQTLPTGRILPVAGTPLDFRVPRLLGEGLCGQDLQLLPYLGYDHNLIFRSGEPEKGFAVCPRSGIRMDLKTTQPAVQLYTGNHVDTDRAARGKGGVRYPRYAGFCLETQHYPCSPNFPQFPTTLLRAGEVYRQSTSYRFSVERQTQRWDKGLSGDARAARHKLPPAYPAPGKGGAL